MNLNDDPDNGSVYITTPDCITVLLDAYAHLKKKAESGLIHRPLTVLMKIDDPRLHDGDHRWFRGLLDKGDI